MNEMSSVITSGKASPEDKVKYCLALKYVEKQKKNNSVILFISLYSLVLYVLSLLYLRLMNDNNILEIILIVLFVLLFILFTLALSKFIVTYFKYIH